MLDRTILPAYRAIEDISFPWPDYYVCQNHLPLYVLNKSIQPIVEVELVFRSGSYYELQPGAAYFTSYMLLEGTKDKTVRAIADVIDGYGATITVRPQVDFCSIVLSTLTKYLAPMLDLLLELLLTANFPAKSFKWLKNLKSQAIQMADKKNAYVAYKLFYEALFTKQHPYGRHLNLADVEAIQLEDLHLHYKKILFADCSAFVSGQVTPAALQSIQQFLEQLPVQVVSAPAQAEFPYKPHKVVDRERKGVQSSIIVGKKLWNKQHPDFLPMLVVNELLGGYFGSRLMHNIREDKGYTYGIHSSLASFQRAGYFSIVTEVSPDMTQDTLAEIYKEIELLQRDLVDATELEKVQNYLLGHFLTTINDPFAIMQKFQSAYFYGLDQSYYTNLLNQVRSLTAVEIRQLAQKYLALDTFTEVVVH
ncbi:MAG: insulinase family protein [Amoebophilaceae bacterium]|nr:insulinase family protein [Amoebophilaceae bacterium]MBX9890213.1 insulinase family protein [Amoebophilaceae bacterium]